MSADNGYVIRKDAATDEYVLQHYFASAVDTYGWPPLDKGKRFMTLEYACWEYKKMVENGVYTEYGLTISADDF